MAFSTKKKRGRPKLTTQKWDYGNDRVQARIAQFRHFKGDSSIGHEMSCAGRLMLVGAFDGMSEAPEAVLSAVLEYANAYWGNFGGGPKVADYERCDKSHDHRWEDPRGERFDAMDNRLRDAGRAARMAVHAVSVDRHWFPDEDVSWAARIIESRLFKNASLAHDSDWAMLDLLRIGASALAAPKMRQAA
jgi:hypothetical protein